MRGTKTGIIFLILAMICSTSVFAQIKTDRFFPAGTKGFFAVTDTNALLRQWSKTDLGSTFQKPAFEPFRTAFAQELEQAWISRFGMTFNDMIAVSAGEIGGGLIATPGKTPGMALILDIAGKDVEVNNFLTKLIRKTTATPKGESHREKVQTPSGVLDVTVLTLPPDQQSSETRTVYYAQFDHYLLAADQKYLIEQISGENASPLAGNPVYQATMKRCIADYPQPTEPLVRFFIIPLEFGEAIHALRTLRQKGDSRKSACSILAKQGFDGIRGVGGVADLASENFEAIFRIKAYIPEEPTLSLKMLTFLDAADIPVPNWIGENTNRSNLANIDTLALFNNIGPLFDDFLETPGVWEETLQSLEKDEKGPKVNLKTDLVAHLGPQVSIMRTFRDSDEKVIAGIAIKTGQAPAVSQALHRMFDTDPDFLVVPYDGDALWLYAPKKIESSKNRESGSRPSGSKRQRPSAVGRAKPTEAQSADARCVFQVSDDTLFVSNDRATLEEALELRKNGQIVPFDQTAEYQSVLRVLQKFSAGNGYFAKVISDNKDGFQANYELVKENRLNQGKTLLTRILRSILTGPDNKPRTDFTIDGSTLPPFSEMDGHVGPSGFYGQNEADGWFFKGVGLRADQVK